MTFLLTFLLTFLRRVTSCKVVMLTPVISSSFVIFMGCDIYIFVTGVNDDGTNHTFSQCNLGGWASARSALLLTHSNLCVRIVTYLSSL